MRSFLNKFHHYPCPHTFFTSVSSLHFLKLKKKLMCLFAYFFDGLWALEMIRVCHHQHQHSFLHLCSYVCLVFHFRHTPRSREESWKATIWSTISSCSVWAWVTQAARSYMWIIERLRSPFTVNAKRWKIEIVTSHVNGEMGGKNSKSTHDQRSVRSLRVAHHYWGD